MNKSTKNKNRINKNNKNTKRKVNRRQTRLPEVIPIVSKCGRDYLSVLTNPFRAISPLPCIPDVIALPSNKFRTRSIGTFETNDSGQGQIGVNPYRTAANDDLGAVNYSTTAIVMAGVNDFNFTAVGSSDVVCAGPYTTAQLSAVPTQLRLVGCGVKVKYAGTELARAGRLILYRAQANNGITNGTIS